jgi:CMP-N,N'-diacetyllegionaminic acid synthase
MNCKLDIIAIIPARGGSKSIVSKNLAILGGKPLLCWPIETALATSEINNIIVSTDNDKIAEVATELGVGIHHRPPELGLDSALVVDTVRHIYQELIGKKKSADIFVLLEATSPLRTPELVSRCLKRLVQENLDSIATFHVAEVNPERAWRIENGKPFPFIDGAIPWKPRQEFPPAYHLNGAVYAFRPGRLPAESLGLLFGKMGAELIDSNSIIDIDDERDLKVANALLES